MSGSVEDFDGLCAIIPNWGGFDLQIRCKYEIGHSGDHSYEKYHKNFKIESSCRSKSDIEILREKDEDGIQRGFIEAVLYHNGINDK